MKYLTYVNETAKSTLSKGMHANGYKFRIKWVKYWLMVHKYKVKVSTHVKLAYDNKYDYAILSKSV